MVVGNIAPQVHRFTIFGGCETVNYKIFILNNLRSDPQLNGNCETVLR